MPKNKQSIEHKMCAAALRLGESRGWRNLTLDRIAKAAKIPSTQTKKRFPDKNKILPAIVAYVSSETAQSMSKPDKHAAPHDRLFEVMMARFDVLQKYRKAILSVMDEARHDSTMACVLFPAQGQAMREMLALAGFGQEGLAQSLVSTGLWVVYMGTLRVWAHDETLDMTKTMAALDRYLHFAGKASDILFRSL